MAPQNINHLPDAILQHILSFMTTEEAVATSLFAKRWRLLWTGVPVLDFQDVKRGQSGRRQREAFEKLVGRALHLNEAGSLERFRLHCHYVHCTPCNFNRWIRNAIGRGLVGEVDIFVPFSKYFVKLPDYFFTIKNLKVLKVSNGIIIDIPDSMSVCFPSLKILHLKSDSIPYSNNKSVSNLVRGCNALEELIVERIFIKDDVRNLIIDVPTLKTLTLNHRMIRIIEEGTKLATYELKINVPNLEYLEIFDDAGSLVHLESVFMNLIEAKVFSNGSSSTDPFKLVKALCNAKFLTISGIDIDFGAPVEDNSFPLFVNLKRLELDLSYGGWDVMPFYLENSPNLEDLVLKLPHTRPSRLKLKHAPKCIPPRLREVFWDEFDGHEGELDMVEYILKNARSLELLQIHSYNLSEDEKYRMFVKLSEFPATSQTCKLRFNFQTEDYIYMQYGTFSNL